MVSGPARVSGGSAGQAAMILGIVGLAGQLFTCGFGGLFLILSLVAWGLGQREVQKLKALGVPLGDLRQARAGHVLGIVGTAVSCVVAILVSILIGALVASVAGEAAQWKLITDF